MLPYHAAICIMITLEQRETEIASSAVSDISDSLYSVSKCKENIKCKIMVDADNDIDDYGIFCYAYIC